VDSAGNVFGTTHEGGNGNGTVFMLTPQSDGKEWKEKVLVKFCGGFPPPCLRGSYPDGGLVMDRAGNLFGTTYEDLVYEGIAFRLAPNATRSKWTATVIHGFCSQPNCADGGNPAAPLIIDGSGNLYGTTITGGRGMGNGEAPCSASLECGTVFELKPNPKKTAWQEETLYSFCSREACADGNLPMAPLYIDGEGNLFGTTEEGGAVAPKLGGNHLGGTVFELSPGAGNSKYREKVLVSFCDCPPNGNEPVTGLASDRAGNLYGTTAAGGVHGVGIVFELKPNATRTQWAKTIIYQFCPGGDLTGCPDGAQPEGRLVVDRAGNLYGTTRSGGLSGAANFPGHGTVFKLSPNAARTKWTETVLHRFCKQKGCPDGNGPVAGLAYAGESSGVLYDGKSALYGTTGYGVTDLGGTVFSIKP
jgi:hypothetical protein